MATPDYIWKEIDNARLAKELGLTRQAVYKWQWSEKGIPAERALEVEKATDIPRSELRPDLWG